jgi:hypothetical protein
MEPVDIPQGKIFRPFARILFVLYDEGGLTMEEIAKRAECSIPTVRNKTWETPFYFSVDDSRPGPYKDSYKYSLSKEGTAYVDSLRKMSLSELIEKGKELMKDW